MFNLILKDILIQKKTFIFAFLYSIFAMFAFQTAEFLQFYIMGSVAVAYLMILTAITLDDKYKSDVLFMSLPLKRIHMVTAKYLSIFVFTAIALLISGVIGVIANLAGFPFDIRYMNITDMLATFVSVGIWASLFLPFYFKYGATHIRIVNILFFLAVFFAPSFLIDFLSKENDSWISSILYQFNHFASELVGLFIFAVILFLLLISYFVSVRIYTKKDF
ncbi:hypothetical protein HNQ80_002982 [Anaerosolibacter carboniphilus]|uniref:ABC-2 family transporter protein n=1 Tax=Anaerosolibacter carboniphilus TaxID=1417629 RepID=A0A841KTZ4_9FIRM|nr:ABC-2 transporter permease [Anaerosolibacter carboniphilus]MBB6216877.1 hypothetical protein [Anaerosolibacter carboniphilus]